MSMFDRMNVAPVSNVVDRVGLTIPAGTVGNLHYSPRRRRWTFVAATTVAHYAINRADLFRFVPRSELVSATLGFDPADGEVAK